MIMRGTEDIFIGFKPEDLKRPIFRIYSPARFIDTLRRKSLTLVRPKLWDDPFENFILQAKVRLPDGRIVSLPASQRMYGQCWSRAKESDGLWRIYSPDRLGIKVRAQPKQMATALAHARAQTDQSCFVGKVEYVSRRNLDEVIKAHFNFGKALTDRAGRELARALLLKRVAFEHEREVRLICCSKDETYDQDTISVEIDTLEIFDEVIVDPRTTIEEYQEIKGVDHRTRLSSKSHQAFGSIRRAGPYHRCE